MEKEFTYKYSARNFGGIKIKIFKRLRIKFLRKLNYFKFWLIKKQYEIRVRKNVHEYFFILYFEITMKDIFERFGYIVFLKCFNNELLKIKYLEIINKERKIECSGCAKMCMLKNMKYHRRLYFCNPCFERFKEVILYSPNIAPETTVKKVYESFWNKEE